MKHISNSFPKTSYDDLARKDRKACSIILGLLKDGLCSRVQIPLATSHDVENDKTVSVDVATLKRIQWAIFDTCSIVFSCEEAHDDKGEVYTIYFAEKVEKPFTFVDVNFRDANKNEQKQKNHANKNGKSKKTDKALEESVVSEQSVLDKDFDKKTVALISKLAVDFGLKVSKERLLTFEKEVEKILHRVEK
jgi:uncharacterized protein YdaT